MQLKEKPKTILKLRKSAHHEITFYSNLLRQIGLFKELREINLIN